MKTFRKLLVWVLCLSLCMSLAIPAFAAGENNNLGVTFSVSLDQASIAQSDADQTVTMILSANQSITMDGACIEIAWADGLKLTDVTTGIVGMSIAKGGLELNTGKVEVDDLDLVLNAGKVAIESDDIENVSGITDMFEITFNVPAGTPAGDYIVGVSEMELTSDYGDIWEDAATVFTTLTIEGQSGGDEPVEPTSGYSAGLTTTTPSVTTGNQVLVSVAVNHADEKSFNAGELVFTYDSAYLTFDKNASTLGGATAKDSAGILTLEDYGAEKACGNGVYVLAFNSVANGETAVSLTSAAFSNQEDAASSDLTEGAINPATVDIKINKKIFTVTLPTGMTGAEVVTDGDSYTFSIADTNYDYTNIKATVDGVEVAVADNGEGNYTIAAVTGNLVVTADRAPKSYSVTFAGNAAADITGSAETATYGTAYTFTMPSAEGWAYSLGGITIGGTAYTGYSVENAVYTIPGTAITGAIEITVTKTQTTASVTVEGTGAGAAAGYEPSATIGESYTLTIVPEIGYTYTVTATMGGESVELTQNDNSYTIAEVTDSIVFTVNCAAVVDGVSVSEYVTLDGTKIWLVKNDMTVAEGKVPAYSGNKMFWSDAYDVYCYLVIAETLSVEDAKAAIGITDGTAAEVVYSMDVNKTGTIDANDAQLAYNIYNAYYGDFTADVTMEKFLLADVNHDGIVNVEDAVAIIASILGI